MASPHIVAPVSRQYPELLNDMSMTLVLVLKTIETQKWRMEELMMITKKASTEVMVYVRNLTNTTLSTGHMQGGITRVLIPGLKEMMGMTPVVIEVRIKVRTTSEGIGAVVKDTVRVGKVRIRAMAMRGDIVRSTGESPGVANEDSSHLNSRGLLHISKLLSLILHSLVKVMTV